MEAKLLDVQGREVGKLPLRDEIFAAQPSKAFLHEFVTVFLANQRRYSASTKTRAEVSGGGRKPWKQKHTGRARAGSIRSPLWRHGGTIFGPHAKELRLEFPRRKAKKALAQALTARFQEGGVVFVEALGLAEPKTKILAGALKSLGLSSRGTLLVLDKPDAALARAGRNLPGFEMVCARDLNAYSVLRSRKLLMTKPALESLGTRWN